ncbi:MAG: hypothetical protein KME35_02660 [Aphanocapsa sp. GSE-SYN-MK-11-07L]|jgi:hypothetical protein|nr:hypothetical protein [Aphanocapsa sp. GSE-SYN-MK-11-07L]
MTPIELRQRGYQALVDSLGAIDAILFLQQAGWGVGNYTAERHQWLSPVTRDEFWQDIQRIRARKANLPVQATQQETSDENAK